MNCFHHGRNIYLPDDWWHEAGMNGFVPTSKSYYLAVSSHKEIQEVSIAEVGPVLRNPIFRDGSAGEGTARERVVRILRDFRSGQVIHPVEVVKGNLEYGHPYQLVHGVHRFYCSLAAGFTHLPTINGFDINAHDN